MEKQSKTNSETSIKVENISKKFSKNLKKSMIYGIEDIARNSVGIRSRSEVLRDTEFWALDGVSFEVKNGECLGVIGHNGSGKTTLLSLLNGIFWPDRGQITIKGRVGALIALGAGFHPMLTGRENIYINGAILGMTRKELDDKFEEIVEFSEMGDFLDTPVKHYSSGMFAKLGFSVAVHVDPDILLIDEVLSVGDIKFQNKAYQKIMDLRDKSTVVFVSHNLGAVSMLCDRVIWLDNGRIRMAGDTQEIVSEYSRTSMLDLVQQSTIASQQDQNKTISGDILVTKIECADSNGIVKETFEYGDDIVLRCHYKAFNPLGKPYFQFDIRSTRTGTVFSASMIADGTDRPTLDKGEGIVECHFKELPLNPGFYTIDVNIRPETGLGKLFRHLSAGYFYVKPKFNEIGWKGPLSAYREMNAGPVHVPYTWHFKK